MSMKALLDTGPWVALIDRSEGAHELCKQWFTSFSGRLYSTEPVLTEALYLLEFSLRAQQAALDFVLRDIVTLVPSDIQSLNTARWLMEKYSDLPMDFADASLVSLSEESGIFSIATLDYRDFSVYRTPGNKKLSIIPTG